MLRAVRRGGREGQCPRTRRFTEPGPSECSLGGAPVRASTKGVEMASTPKQTQNTAAAELRAELGGELIVSGDPGFDEARQVFFRGIDRRPAAIARVGGADDVARVVRRARESRLELAVRCGVHSRAGYAPAMAVS